MAGVAAVLAIIVIGAVAFIKMGKGETNTNINPSATTSTQATQQKSFQELFSMGANQKCEVTDPQGSTGTIYIGTGKVRADFATTYANQTATFHLYSDGKTVFLWQDGSAEGWKVNTATLTDATATDSMFKTLNSNVNYSCSSWIADNSLFAIPSNVVFTDYSEMLKTMQQQMSEEGRSMSAACQACAQLTGDAQMQCLTTLNCSN